MTLRKQSERQESHEDGANPLLRHLLRPVARFCIRRSVKLQRLMETMKSVLVEVGQEELERVGETASVSRLAVMTGVHRKDITRLTRGDESKEPAVDIFTRVVGQWRNDPRFSRRGQPRPLESVGGDAEFAELVRSVSKELNPYTVLLELDRLGMVSRSGDTVTLKANEYAPAKNADESFQLMSADIDDLLKGVEENVFERKRVPHLHLTTRYDNICPEFLPEIQRWCMQEGAKLHARARNYFSKFDKDLNPRLRNKEGGSRVVLGSFSLSEPEQANNKKGTRK
ncbi:MAG: DUF6502 family protein [Bdellovibrionota bacterium]